MVKINKVIQLIDKIDWWEIQGECKGYDVVESMDTSRTYKINNLITEYEQGLLMCYDLDNIIINSNYNLMCMLVSDILKISFKQKNSVLIEFTNDKYIKIIKIL